MNVVPRIKSIIRRYKHLPKIEAVVKLAIDSALKIEDIQVSCTCPDFTYRFSYEATTKGYGLDVNQHIPATIRNPKNKGSVCKHLVRVLNAPSLWKPKIINQLSWLVKKYPDLFGYSNKDGGS